MTRPLLDLSGTASVTVDVDVDGTLAGPDHQISPRTRAAMRGIEQRGVPVVLATGRARDNVLDVARQAGLRSPAVSCNGAVVSEPESGRDLRVRPMAPDDVTAMIRVHEQTGAPLTWFTPRGIFATSVELREFLLALGDGAVFVDRVPTRVGGDLLRLRPARPGPRASRGARRRRERRGLDGAHRHPGRMGNARPEARAAAVTVAGDDAEEGAAVFLEEVLRRMR